MSSFLNFHRVLASVVFCTFHYEGNRAADVREIENAVCVSVSLAVLEECFDHELNQVFVVFVFSPIP